jgi:hypothetical protein
MSSFTLSQVRGQRRARDCADCPVASSCLNHCPHACMAALNLRRRPVPLRRIAPLIDQQKIRHRSSSLPEPGR